MSSAPSRTGDEGSPRVRWAFREWRRSRPFWAGVWTVLAGVEILSIPIAPLSLMIHEGVAGVAGALMGIFLVVLGIAMWLAPDHRVFAGIAALVFAVASLVLSNFGGFLIGFLLGILGGAMAVSWATDEPPPPAGTAPRPGPRWDWPPGPGSGGPPPGDPPGPPEAGPRPAAEEPGAGRPRQPPPGPDPGPGSATAAQDRGNAARRSRRPRPDRLRALGVLPVGALLAGAVQPAAPATRAATAVMDPPSPPPGSTGGGGTLNLCSLLGGLLAAAGPTAHGTGSGDPAQAQDGRHPPAGTGRPATAAPGLPPQRTRRPPEHRGPAGGAPAPGDRGLLGAVTGLLGLTSPGAAPAPRHSVPAPGRSAPAAFRGAPATPERARSAAAGHPAGSTPSAAPAAPPAAPPGPEPAAAAQQPGTNRPGGPTSAEVPRPPLPRDGVLDGPMSLLPLRLTLGDGASSPGCTPSVSLALAPAAAAYRDGVAAARPFRVLTPLLFLTGLAYQGITEVPTRDGPQRVLVFTASRVDIADLRQTAPLLPPSCAPARTAGRPPFYGLPGLRLPLLDMGLPGIGFVDPRPLPWDPCQGRLETDGAPWGTTTATGGPVVLLTKVLSGSLLGLLPVTFTPDMPPPLPPGLTLPIPIFFTNVTSYLQQLRADALTVPGLHQHAFG